MYLLSEKCRKSFLVSRLLEVFTKKCFDILDIDSNCIVFALLVELLHCVDNLLVQTRILLVELAVLVGRECGTR